MNKIDELIFKLRGKLIVYMNKLNSWIDDCIGGK